MSSTRLRAARPEGARPDLARPNLGRPNLARPDAAWPGVAELRAPWPRLAESDAARAGRIAALAAGRRGQLRRRSARLRPGLATSVLLHLGLAALVVIATLQRERPPEPLPPPAYALHFEAGAPDRPAEQDPAPSPPPAEAAPPTPTAPALPTAPPPPATAPPNPRLLANPPTPRPPPVPALPVPPPPAPPRPRDTAELLPEPALPMPPPPAPPSPTRERSPPPPATAQRPNQPLPGLYLPEGLTMAPRQQAARPRPNGSRAPLDLSLDQLATVGRASPEPQAEVRGAQVGPDWRNAFRRWLEENKRYPENARVVNEQGTNRVEILAGPDGRVRGARLLRQSGSVWLDAGTLSLFRGAVLPAFPPGADPNGVIVDLTIHYILIRQ